MIDKMTLSLPREYTPEEKEQIRAQEAAGPSLQARVAELQRELTNVTRERDTLRAAVFKQFNVEPPPRVSKPDCVLATFVPQTWERDYAVRVALGETQWDITNYIQQIGAEEALKLKDDSYKTDDLRFVGECPTWVKDWIGPFYIMVEDAIRDFFSEPEVVS